MKYYILTLIEPGNGLSPDTYKHIPYKSKGYICKHEVEIMLLSMSGNYTLLDWKEVSDDEYHTFSSHTSTPLSTEDISIAIRHNTLRVSNGNTLMVYPLDSSNVLKVSRHTSTGYLVIVYEYTLRRLLVLNLNASLGILSHISGYSTPKGLPSGIPYIMGFQGNTLYIDDIPIEYHQGLIPL